MKREPSNKQEMARSSPNGCNWKVTDTLPPFFSSLNQREKVDWVNWPLVRTLSIPCLARFSLHFVRQKVSPSPDSLFRSQFLFLAFTRISRLMIGLFPLLAFVGLGPVKVSIKAKEKLGNRRTMPSHASGEKGCSFRNAFEKLLCISRDYSPDPQTDQRQFVLTAARETFRQRYALC